MDKLLRRLYGRRSERLDAAQLLLFGQAIDGRRRRHGGLR